MRIQDFNAPLLAHRSLELNATTGGGLESRVRNCLPSVIDFKNPTTCFVREFLIGVIAGLLVSAGSYKVGLLRKIDTACDSRRSPIVEV